MVWFQCEDCGENLKKPKLLNHFRMCSANKLSCIDCGEMFGQQSVQAHTQCITEAEKYGPKGQGKVSNNTPAKANTDSKQKPPVDTNVGLSSRPPWFCSLCNTNATSKQTLLLHAEGKKHRAKARAFHASKQPKETEGSITPSTNEVTGDPQKAVPVDRKNETTPKEHDSSKASVLSETENEALTSKKKRKLQASDDGSAKSKDGTAELDDLSNGEVIQGKKAKKEEEGGVKKAKHIDTSTNEQVTKNDSAEQPKKKIKWKKLISSALKSNSDGTMKMRKLEKAVLKSLQEDGINEDKDQVKENLIHKINSSSRFRLENKLVYLVAKS